MQNRTKTETDQHGFSRGGTATKFEGSLQWIENAGIISRCYNISTLELPLDGNAKKDIFKVYMSDIGLLVSTLEDGTQFDILQGNLLGYKGEVTLVEVKATSGNTKSTKTILSNPSKYHVNSAIKLGDYNIGKNDQLLTLPLYIAFLLTEY